MVPENNIKVDIARFVFVLTYINKMNQQVSHYDSMPEGVNTMVHKQQAAKKERNQIKVYQKS